MLKHYNAFLLLSLFLTLFIKGGEMKGFAIGNNFSKEIIGEFAFENDESNPFESSTSIKINFGNTPSSDSKWNNVNRSGNEVSLKNLIGEDSGVKVIIGKIFSGDNTEGVENTNTELDMPTDVAKSALWGYARGDFDGHTITVNSSLVFSQLNKDLVYDFYIFGSRKNVNDNRETKYAIKGDNLKSNLLNTANNDDEITSIKGIKPNEEGEIHLTVSVGENNDNEYHFYYLNALQLVAREYTEGDFDDNEEEEKKEDNAIKILAIGNSFSEDAIEQNLYELAAEAGVELIIGNAYRGGQGLDSHWNVVTNDKADFEYRKVVEGVKTNTHGKTLLECLLDEKWDYITFQQVSQDSGLPNTYEPWLGYLLDYVREHALNPDVQFAIHRTWAYEQTSDHGGFANYGRDQQRMYESIVNAVNSVVKKYEGVIDMIIPAGTAIQNGRTSFIGDNFCRDGYHLTYGLGRYTAACTWFEVITGKSVLGMEYRPSSVSEVEAMVAQYAASYAVAKPHEITVLDNIGYDDINTVEPQAPININFGSTTSYPEWNDIHPSNKYLFGLKDTDGADTEIIIMLDNEFSGTNTDGVRNTDTGIDIPADVAGSCIWGYSKGSFGGGSLQADGGFLFTHLNTELVYDFYIYGSRDNVSDNRETQYLVEGENRKRDHVDAAKNSKNLAQIKGIKPTDDGQIRLTVSAGNNNTNVNNFYYINALQMVARQYQDGDFDDDEPDTMLSIDPEKEYYIRHITTGLCLQMQEEGSSGEEGDFCINRVDKTNPAFRFSFVPVTEGKSIYNIAVNNQYINAGEDGICIIGDETNRENGQIRLEVQSDLETFKLRALWRNSPNYINITSNSFGANIYANRLDGAIWKLEEAETMVNISSVDNDSKITLYPTYSTGEVTIQTSEKATIKVMDLSGQIMNTYSSEGILSVNLNYPNGVYLVEVNSDTSKKVYRVILNR